MGTMGIPPGERFKNLWSFAVPGVFIFCTVVIIPCLYGGYLTFTDWDGVKQVKNLVGFSNYLAVFRDTEFWKSMSLTLLYVVLSVVLVNLLAFVLAYALTNGLKGQNFFRAGFFTPNLIGGVVFGFIWQCVFARALVSFSGGPGWNFFVSSLRAILQ